MIYERLVRPLLFRLEPEAAHELALLALAALGRYRVLRNLASRQFAVADSRLEQELWGFTFPNPIGLAAGFDKEGVASSAYPAMGFGFAVLGSATLRPWPGNPRPRLFRLPKDGALINRMGLNNPGVKKLLFRVCRLSESLEDLPIWVSVTKTPDPNLCGEAGMNDFVEGAALAAQIADIVELNISCPNTAEGQTFQEPRLLDRLLWRIFCIDDRYCKFLVKFSPDIDRGMLKESLVVCRHRGVAGIVAGNSTNSRERLAEGEERIKAIGKGGLTGRPLKRLGLKLVEEVKGFAPEMPIVGCGGIESAQDVLDYARAGARLFQLLTAWPYHGPGLVRTILSDLLWYMDENRISPSHDCVDRY